MKEVEGARQVSVAGLALDFPDRREKVGATGATGATGGRQRDVWRGSPGRQRSLNQAAAKLGPNWDSILESRTRIKPWISPTSLYCGTDTSGLGDA